METPRHARIVGFFAIAYFVLAAAYTWPLPIRLTGVPHDLGDPLLTTWLMWWSGTQGGVPLTAQWWNAPIFFPAPGVFAFSENLLGFAPIAAPLTALTRQPLIGHNVAFILTIVLSGLGAHFLAYTITKRHDAAAVAGVAFAFAPYRLAQAPHIQVLASFWTPICLAALHRYDRTGRTRWILLAVMAWVIQAVSCGYYLFFLAALVTLWFLWFAIGRWPMRRVAAAGAAFAAGALLLAPLFHGYQVIMRDTYGLKRSIGEIRAFSADVAGLLYATDELLVWGWVQVFQRPESNLFPGLTIVLLAAFAIRRAHPFRIGTGEPGGMRAIRLLLTALLVLLLIATAIPIAYGAWQLTIGGVRLLSIARADKPVTLALGVALALMASLPRMRAAFHRRSALEFYLLAAFAMWLFSLGPDPTVMDRRALYQAPYGWLMRLPGFDGLRVPARFWMMALACLSVVAALAVDRLSGRARRVVVVLAIAGLLIDGWPREFRVFAAPDVRPSPAGVSARLDLPINDETDARAMYQQMFDPVPLFNGFSGYVAPHYYAMRTLLEEGDPRIFPILAARGPIGVVIDHAGDPDGSVRRFVLSTPGATVERMERDWSSYRVPPSGTAPDVPERSGTPIPIKSLSALPNPADARRALDGDLRTAWRGDASREIAEMTIELEQPSPVAQIVIELGDLITDFPRGLQIDVSPDGSVWEPAWTGSPALHAYHGAIRHPRKIPIVFPLNTSAVRFIRLRQTGFGKYPWSVAELHVQR
jgi:hypothetical protein